MEKFRALDENVTVLTPENVTNLKEDSVVKMGIHIHPVNHQPMMKIMYFGAVYAIPMEIIVEK
jgi:hypothetical protein